MSTIIYPSPIFGPVHSRRLGISLGINLLPADGKVCSFDCIYCECGFNEDHRPTLPLPTREEVAARLEEKLLQMTAEGQLPDVLTFAGNGEPTCHPHFAEIIDDVIRLRNQYCPRAKVSVLSNSTMIHRQAVHDALMRVDNNILKLDTVDPIYINKVDHPNGTYDVEKIIERMKAFNGHIIIQTMFMRGEVTRLESGVGSQESVDNIGEEYVGPWLEAVKAIKPQQVMIYTIDRETPTEGLLKATREQLDAIRDRVIAAGIPCTASY
ncbi:MAG: radical SAM protein [Prevotella sp.]|nr:radical SAM protein [Prevotella sp.]